MTQQSILHHGIMIMASHYDCSSTLFEC